MPTENPNNLEEPLIAFKNEVQELKEQEEGHVDEQGRLLEDHLQGLDIQDLDGRDMDLYYKLKRRQLKREEIEERRGELVSSDNEGQKQFLAYIVNKFQILEFEEHTRPR